MVLDGPNVFPDVLVVSLVGQMLEDMGMLGVALSLNPVTVVQTALLGGSLVAMLGSGG